MDHYSNLGVDKTATPDDIKKAYRKLASQHHPDKGGNTAKFQEIQTSYDTLSDPQKREEYDNPSPFGPQFGSQQANPFANMQDIFGHMFRQHTHRPQQQQVYRTSVWITLDQVYSGGNQVLKLQTQTGTHNVTIGIPVGIQDGGQVRCENVIDGASLLVEFRISPHLIYTRKGNDLECNQSISVLDLIVGTSFEFTTLSGKTLEVKVPPKTQPYVHLKLAGYGLPILNSNAFGDQIILLKLFVPTTIDDRIISIILESQAK